MKFRPANPHDAPIMSDVDRLSWPAALAVRTDEFAARIAAFPAGQWVAERNGRIVGTASAQRINDRFLRANGDRYERLTDGNRFTASHDPGGEIYQLISVGVLPKFRSQGLGRTLVDRQIDAARRTDGMRRILGFTRPAGYRRHRKLSIEEYLAGRDDGRCPDPVVDFHLSAGAVIVSVHADFRPQDTDACGYGVLIEYPIEGPCNVPEN